MLRVRDRSLIFKAADRKNGMTFGDLREFVADAMLADVPDDTKVEALVGFRGQVTRLEVTVKEGP